MENNENLNVEELDLQELEDVAGGKGGYDFVKTTGDVYARKKPDKTSGSLGVIPSGTTVSYLGKQQKDDRGVVWYKVNYNGNAAWVSSKYAKLVK